PASLPMKKIAQTTFQDLTPDRVISLAEEALGQRFSGICRPLNSYINRVYELELEDGGGIRARC
ncbi:MAG: hypothetical protein ACWGSD_21035, partial [Thermodesulfobacteriota bacterium]